MRRFVDDDTGYLEWLAANPGGYVVNVPRSGKGAAILHVAACPTISGRPARGARWTGPYVKLCGARAELESVLAVESRPVRACGSCLRDEHPPLRVKTSTERREDHERPAQPWHHATATTATAVARPERFRRPAGVSIPLPIAPRLASWNRADSPDQIRLEEFLAGTAVLALPVLATLRDPLAMQLDVALPTSVRLLDAHDLDNYLYPLAARLTKLTGRQFVTVWGTKAYGSGSRLTLATAVADPAAHLFTITRVVNVDAPAHSVEFKRQIRDQLGALPTLTDGPVRLHITFEVSRTRNWMDLWKQTIDSLDPVLGSNDQRDWHPRDGRITELALHQRRRADAATHITIVIQADTNP